MADIFISYASEDRDKAIPIVKALQEKGWSLFWDSTSIPVGRTWRQFIKEGLEATRCVLVLWSEKSIDSEWVIEEADHGKARRILIPALIDDIRPPIGFGQIQAARLVGWNGESNHAGYQQLIRALTGLIGLPEVPQQKITNSIGMEFVRIPAGWFMMGSRMMPIIYNETPYHPVNIEKPFYLQTTPVTQGQWQRVMKDSPSGYKSCGHDCPVEKVSWEESQLFIKKLNQIEKKKDYCLPTEAAWEYACRAGSNGTFFFGDDAQDLIFYGWYLESSFGQTHPVGEKK